MNLKQAVTQYLATCHKWSTMKNGPLAQRLPSYAPGRDFLSSNRANSLKVPFTKKEALLKLACLESALNDDWLGDMKMYKKQHELVIQLLVLGAYSLPGLCLSSVKLDMHLKDNMQKELNKCMSDLRKGRNVQIKREIKLCSRNDVCNTKSFN